jgi:hypothetical protein
MTKGEHIDPNLSIKQLFFKQFIWLKLPYAKNKLRRLVLSKSANLSYS